MLVSFGIAFLIVVLLVLTRRLHGRYSLDSQAGVQKLHTAPTPRIGGIAIMAGFLCAGIALPEGERTLWAQLSIAAIPAFAAGLAEDMTKRVGVGARLAATICSGLIFCLLSGIALTRVDLPGADWLLSFPVMALFFTAFAIGGVANAINIIDGVNGLASGTVIIILSGFAALAWQQGDTELVGVCLIMAAALGGFFLMNFPAGRIFLGDAGAYTAGFILAAIAVALPMRNPEISPLIGLLALSYPVIETMVSIHRRMVREGAHPGQPDRLHLHSLVYRSRAKRLAQLIGAPHMRNSLTSVILWSLSLIPVALMVLFHNSTVGILLSLAAMTVLYLMIYRRVALLRRLAPKGQNWQSVTEAK